jgi:eukaryotic-like serine/threonine-protein kinase
MAAAATWRGTDRFEIVGRLGEGGMGVVYEAFDRQRGERVALKTLRHFDADALYRFKQEFRTLADVLHPNLVHLHELVAVDKEDVFFTMELVEGTDFLDYVQRSNASRVGPQSNVLTIPPELRRARQALPPIETISDPASPMAPELERLQRALIQLVEGVAALHAAGKLHRDLKPSNVRVTRDGRVVILDFGVAIDLKRRGSARDDEAIDEMVGTASYMAPEQALGEALAPASDWYSVGAILYEALVGRALHVGPALEVLSTKCQVEPTPPSARVGGVPPSLDALCLELMSIDPAKRPAAPEILRRLGHTSEDRSATQPPPKPSSEESLIGREGLLARLHDSLERNREGHAVSVRVSGASGMGKSALVHHFLNELEARGDVLVLRGRTYERESVPYKAFDSVVDALTRHLIFLEECERELPMPADIEALAQVFPVLRRVHRIEKRANSKLDDPTTLRQRAFAALRELLDSLARSRPVVVSIDDVHWGDIDSAALLLELVRPPSAPPILVLMTHRAEDADTSHFLAEIGARWPEDAEVRELDVGPLRPKDARQLALALLGARGPEAQRAAESIAQESGGSPFLVEELARAASGLHRAAHEAHGRGAISLEEMIGERASHLPEDALRMLQVIATAGRPLSVSIVGEAAAVLDSAPQLVALLRARRFVRVGLRQGIETVETSHNRIRETVIASLAAETARGHHARLAQAFEATPDSDPEAIATHLLCAGDRERAGHFAERAADQALEKLAFAQAERLFQLAIDSIPASSEARKPLLVRMAKSSEWAGHSEKAARAYIAAAELAAAGERVQLERAAASQLIAAGHIDEGAAAFRRVLAALGMAVPRSRFWLLFLIRAYRFTASLLLLLGFREKGNVPSDKDGELNVLHAMGRGLAVVDPLAANYLKARYLVEALRAGSRPHLIRAATLEAGSLGALGKRTSRKEETLFNLARRLAEESGDEGGLGLYELSYGINEYLRGRWRLSLELLERAQVRLVAIRAWQANASVYRIYALVSLGDLPEVKARSKTLLADAERRGDRYTAANLLASHPTAAWLASDDVDGVRRQLKGAIADWSRGRFLVQHWQAMLWEAETHLYVGDGEDAWQRLERDERRYEASWMGRIQLIRAWTLFIRGRSAVASLAGLEEADRDRRLREARGARRELNAEGMPWTDALAAMLGASIASASNDKAGAERELRQAVALAEGAEMALHAAAGRQRLGLLIGGESGKTMRAEAETAMRPRGVRVPMRYVQMLLPGTWPAEHLA